MSRLGLTSQPSLDHLFLAPRITPSLCMHPAQWTEVILFKAESKIVYRYKQMQFDIA